MNKDQEEYNSYTSSEIEEQKFITPVYSGLFPDFVVDRSVASYDWDLALYKDTIVYYVEEKFRLGEIKYDDFLIELVQDAARYEPQSGWFYKTKADYIFYVNQRQRLYTINWKIFKPWFIENMKKIAASLKLIPSAKGKGYTINIAIKWKDMPEGYWKSFDISK